MNTTILIIVLLILLILGQLLTFRKLSGKLEDINNKSNETRKFVGFVGEGIVKRLDINIQKSDELRRYIVK